MQSPMQRVPADLAKCAEVVEGYSNEELKAVARTLGRIAGMLKPLPLGEFGVVQKDGTITPTNRVRMPRLR
jgi:hypothetical protein